MSWRRAQGLAATVILLLTRAVAAHAGSIVLGTQLEPPGLDPTISASAAIGDLTFPSVYQGLVHLAPGGAVEPLLATQWEVSDDLTRWRFHLRPGVRFHDGAPFDAAAVRFTFERAVAPASRNPQKQLYAVIGSVEIIDPLTVDFHLTHPDANLLERLGWSAAVIVSPGSAEDDAVRPVGTGPFRFVSWQRGDAVRLARNDDYWGSRPALDAVTFRFIANPSAAVDALLAGDIDGYPAFPAPESVSRLQHDPRFDVAVGPGEGKTIVALNERVAPFGDVRVRQALAYAIDRQAIVDAAMFGFGTPIGSHYSPLDPGYTDLAGLHRYDPGKARALLAAAGYPHGFATTLVLPPLAYARRSGEMVAAFLKQVGVTCDLVQIEWVPWLDQVFGRHDFSMTLVAHVEPMDFQIYARPDYYFGYHDPAYAALIDRLDRAPDTAGRLSLLSQVQRKLADDAANLFLFDLPAISVWRAGLRGITYRTPVQTFDLASAVLAPGAAASSDTRAGAGEGVPAVVATAACLGMALVVLLIRAGIGFATRRIAALAGTLLAASLVIFSLVQLAPGDPARFMLGMNADPAALAGLRASLGLDRPFPLRYVAWLAGLVRGDFGTSLTYHLPVAELLIERLAVSLPLTLLALALSTLAALVAGVAAAHWRRRWPGRLVEGVLTIAVAVPNFWFGLLLAGVFGVTLHWFGAGGFPGWSAGAWAVFRALLLPAMALALPQAAILGKVLAGALAENGSRDYVRTARAKGLGDFEVLLRHMLPNSLLPVLTILGMQFSFLLAGGVLIENVFFLPGLGRLVFEAINQRDLVVVESVAMVLVAQVIVVTLLADLAHAAADPRLRRLPS